MNEDFRHTFTHMEMNKLQTPKAKKKKKKDIEYIKSDRCCPPKLCVGPMHSHASPLRQRMCIKHGCRL